MIRSLLVVLWILIFLIPLGIPLLLILWIVGWFSPLAREKAALRIVQGVLHVILFLSGTKLTVTGKENIPDDRAVVFISNHRSYFDTVIGYTFVRNRGGFVAKKEMKKVPLVNLWMLMLHCTFLDRDNPRAGIKTILQAIDYAKNGISIWICPEGTRAHEDGLIPFHEGSFKIAEKSGAPVIPVTFTHTDEIYELHRPFIRAAHVSVHFGEPIETAGMSREEKKALPRKVEAQIAETYRQIL